MVGFRVASSSTSWPNLFVLAVFRVKGFIIRNIGLIGKENGNYDGYLIGIIRLCAGLLIVASTTKKIDANMTVAIASVLSRQQAEGKLREGGGRMQSVVNPRLCCRGLCYCHRVWRYFML